MIHTNQFPGINFDVAAEFIAHRRQHLFGKCMLSGLERKRTKKAAVNTSAEIASSIAAWIVQRPSTESCTTPVYLWSTQDPRPKQWLSDQEARNRPRFRDVKARQYRLH